MLNETNFTTFVHVGGNIWRPCCPRLCKFDPIKTSREPLHTHTHADTHTPPDPGSTLDCPPPKTRIRWGSVRMRSATAAQLLSVADVIRSVINLAQSAQSFLALVIKVMRWLWLRLGGAGREGRLWTLVKNVRVCVFTAHSGSRGPAPPPPQHTHCELTTRH